MVVLLIIIGLLMLYNIDKCKGKDFLSLKQTTSINGIFIFFVFFRHLSQYISFNSFIDKPMVLINECLGQLIVCMFLFNSGFGIMQSIKNKKNYVNSIPKNRILKTIIQFDICVLFFLIIKCIFGKNISLSQLLLSLICVNSIGNSNWYILTIIVMWFITFISFKLNDKPSLKGIISCMFLSIIYILILVLLKMPSYYYNTAICFVYGMLFSYYYSNIKKFLSNSRNWIICFTINLLLFLPSVYLIYLNSNLIIVYEIMAILFTNLIVLFQYKITIYNKILYSFGKNLFYLYILQRIPMFVFKELGLANYNKYLYAGLCFIFMIILAYLFQFITFKINDITKNSK